MRSLLLVLALAGSAAGEPLHLGDVLRRVAERGPERAVAMSAVDVAQSEVRTARMLPNPAILIADEPTGNLDEATGSEIVDLLFASHAGRGTTLVLVTHDPLLAGRCDRVVRMRSGRIDGEASREAQWAGVP